MAVEVRVPELGESVTEAVVARWLKQSGDHVNADEPILEIETEKATMEIVADAAGRLEIVEPAGSRVQVGALVARIAEAAPEQREAAPERREAAPERREAAPEQRETASAPVREAPTPERRGVVPVRPEPRAVEEAPVAAAGGARQPVGPAERVEHRPARREEAAPERREAAPMPPRREPATVRRLPTADADVERVPMTELRRTIAARLVEAQRNAAILTTFNEVDLAELLALRKRYRERFRARHGVDLGLMSLFARATVQALRDIPVVNARIDGTDIVHHRRVHLGIAVATPRGLVVPVVRNADRMSLAEIERAVDELARRARDGKLAPDDLAGGTFTITNGGVFGSMLSTPLLNPPQSGILGMHRIQDRPVAVDGQVVVRPMMYVALSYDHRLVDGEQAVRFLVRVKEQLEDPARMVLEV